MAGRLLVVVWETGSVGVLGPQAELGRASLAVVAVVWVVVVVWAVVIVVVSCWRGPRRYGGLCTSQVGWAGRLG